MATVKAVQVGLRQVHSVPAIGVSVSADPSHPPGDRGTRRPGQLVLPLMSTLILHLLYHLNHHVPFYR